MHTKINQFPTRPRKFIRSETRAAAADNPKGDLSAKNKVGLTPFESALEFLQKKNLRVYGSWFSAFLSLNTWDDL